MWISHIIKAIDQLTEITGRASSWIFFCIGIIVAYEVVMRYLFTKPTVWVDEVSIIMQIWATFIAIAFSLKYKEMIIINILFKEPNTIIRKILETFSYTVIIIFSYITLWYGFELWLNSTLKHHTTDTYLAIPKWFTEASIWVGFVLLFLQAFVEIIKVWMNESKTENS
jgi:TRAP-type C4-dicarboxylate transport system permease small subunit